MVKNKKDQTTTTPDNVKLNLDKPSHKYTEVCLEEETNWVSKLFFYWTNTIIKYGTKHTFSEKDLFEVRKDEKFAYARNKYLKAYDSQKGREHPSVTKSMYYVVQKPFLLATFLLVISSLLQFAGPLLLKEILKFLVNPNMSMSKGYIYASGMLAAFLLRAIMTQHGMHNVISFSLKNLVASQAAIFDKILKIKSSARGYVDTGKIVNLATVDCLGIYRFSTMISYFVTAPFIIVAALILIIIEVGASGLVGLAVIFIGTILNSIVSGKIIQYRFKTLIYNDQRSKAIAEYIAGIRVVKYYGWEKFALKRVGDIRTTETELLFEQSVWRSLLDFLSNIIPIFISISVFGVYVAVGNDLTPTKAFTTLALFNLIQMPVRMLGFSLFFFANTKVSLKRIQHFSEWENHEPIFESETIEKGAVQVANGKFSWDTEASLKHSAAMKTLFAAKGRKGPPGGPKGKPAVKKPEQKALQMEKKTTTEEGASPDLSPKRAETESGPLVAKGAQPPVPVKTAVDVILHDINLDVKPGELVGVIGQVGSGKSSLVNAIIGEMHKINGDVKYRGKIAYVPQQAWLRNATLKDNILFGLPYNDDLYHHVLNVCELADDIAMLPGGDQTEIGERGINLSGGQKQRVSIARAVYAQADIYIIDDCLSALDAHVGRQIYEHVLRGELRNKTVIFVTHALHYVMEADKVAVMKKGRIVEIDSPAILQSRPESEFNRLTVNTKSNDPDSPAKEEKEKKEAGKAAKGDKAEAKKGPAGNEEEMKKKGQLAAAEQSNTGAVPFKVYKQYVISGGVFFTSITAVFFVLSQFARTATDLWLSAWSSDYFKLDSGYYILYYFILSIVTGITVLIRGIFFGLFSRETSVNLFSRLLVAIFRSPMNWFDVTPSGQILNRTSKDQDDIDANLPFTIQMSVQNLLMLIGTIISIGVLNPLFFAFAAVIIIYYIYAIITYLKASRELKRVERVALGPALSLFSECANGYQVIRAFKNEEFFLTMFEQRFDKYLKAASGQANLERWVTLRTDIFASLIVGAACYFGVLSKDYNIMSDDPSLIGLSISWSLTITGIVSFAIKTLSDTELQMNSVERILQYIDSNEQEADWDNAKAPEAWPHTGKYDVENITYRYREGLPNVIHGINFHIDAKERIGVVGRTGSGKSTLTLGFLRILELAEQDGKKGKINLDGVEIGGIGLHELRKKITIIPQDPVLFTGTVRSNVDPFNEFSDKDIIDALKKVHIWDQLKMAETEQGHDALGRGPMKIKKGKGAKGGQPQAVVEKKNLTDDEKKLRMIIADSGSNFSLGQRQLICMARALVRRPKVLLMDEATASIDELTDHLIQKMIKSEFNDTTVITIAHRLNTIIQYDRILVLDQGKIAEFDSPINLLDNGDSYFAKLIKENGPDFEAKMRYLAKHKEIDADALKENGEEVKLITPGEDKEIDLDQFATVPGENKGLEFPKDKSFNANSVSATPSKQKLE